MAVVVVVVVVGVVVIILEKGNLRGVSFRDRRVVAGYAPEKTGL